MLKKIHVISSTIILSILIILLVFNLYAKKALEEVINETWSSMISNVVSKDESSESNDFFQEILNNEDVKKFLGEYSSSEELEKIKEKWNDTTETSKEAIESIKKEYSGVLEQFIEEQEQYLNPEQQMLIEVVKGITNVKIKWILLALIGINLVIIAFTEKSFHKWIRSLAWSCILSGVGVIAICKLIIKYLLSYLPATVTLKALIDPAIVLIVAGVLIRIVYLIFEIILKINKNEKKIEKQEREKEDEVSEVFES